MQININEKQYEAKFTFNSFKHMRDFDLTALDMVETRPFVLIDVAGQLLLGALNFDKKNSYSEGDVEYILEEYIENGSIVELVEQLVNELQESGFFKSLQAKN